MINAWVSFFPWHYLSFWRRELKLRFMWLCQKIVGRSRVNISPTARWLRSRKRPRYAYTCNDSINISIHSTLTRGKFLLDCLKSVEHSSLVASKNWKPSSDHQDPKLARDLWDKSRDLVELEQYLHQDFIIWKMVVRRDAAAMNWKD